ncbi:probable protein S-acyltransferase 23 [Tanacetum coccineum]
MLASNLLKVTAVVGLWRWTAVSLSVASLYMFARCSRSELNRGPLLTIDLANTPYWTDNWSQLCPTCKVKEGKALTEGSRSQYFFLIFSLDISDMIVLILPRVINHVPDKGNFPISRSVCPSNEGHAKSRTINILKNISPEEGMLYTTHANTIHTPVPWFLCKIVGQDICHCVELTIVDAKTRSMQLEHQSTEIRVDYSKHPAEALKWKADELK